VQVLSWIQCSTYRRSVGFCSFHRASDLSLHSHKLYLIALKICIITQHLFHLWEILNFDGGKSNDVLTPCWLIDENQHFKKHISLQAEDEDSMCLLRVYMASKPRRTTSYFIYVDQPLVSNVIIVCRQKMRGISDSRVHFSFLLANSHALRPSFISRILPNKQYNINKTYLSKSEN
jgi:hypothetical protein